MSLRCWDLNIPPFNNKSRDNIIETRKSNNILARKPNLLSSKTSFKIKPENFPLKPPFSRTPMKPKNYSILHGLNLTIPNIMFQIEQTPNLNPSVKFPHILKSVKSHICIFIQTAPHLLSLSLSINIGRRYFSPAIIVLFLQQTKMFNKIMKSGHRKSQKTDKESSHSTNDVVLTTQTTGLENLPMLREVPLAERQTLFYKKVQICYLEFDFTETMKLMNEKEIKRQSLLELIDFIQSGSCKLTEMNQEEMVKMFSVHLFRTMPPSSRDFRENNGVFGMEDDYEYLDPSWPHLMLVYELLLRYIVSSDTDTKIAKKYVDHTFVLKLIDLFDSEDRREREYLKTVLHRIYGNFMVHRPFIRKAINNVFYRFVYESERHCGIAQLLEILGSIINGFALPMKEEHKLFLVRVLIPLHKPKSVVAYHQQLAYCVTQFVEKDSRLADPVVRGLLKCWPMTYCQKEVLFLGEIAEVLEATRGSESHRCMVPLFKRIAQCLTSAHFQVAERALLMWNSDDIVSLIAQNRSVILPIVFEALEKNIRSHWNPAVHSLSVNIQKMFLEMDVGLFEECQRQYAEKVARAKELEEYQELAWQRLEMAAADAMIED